jgi:hypothetical protein
LACQIYFSFEAPPVLAYYTQILKPNFRSNHYY